MLSKPLILLAVEGREERTKLAGQLREADLACEFADERHQVIEHLEHHNPATVILDVNFGGESSVPLLQMTASLRNGVPVVFRARRSTPELELALQASAAGADHILLAPHDDSELAPLVDRARQYFDSVVRRRLEGGETDEGKSRSDDLDTWLLGDSPAIAEIRSLILAIADTRASVLIQGESGTGKEHIARGIHRSSRRRHKPFVAVDMAALTPGSAEEILFGSEGGLSSEGPAPCEGKCEAADGGTLFLDELGELEPIAQMRLLRFLESGAFERGEGSPSPLLDVRVIAATHRDPRHLVGQGLLREDLYFRLNVVPVRVPPLRERLEDVEPLARHFVRQSAAAHNRQVEGISREAIDLLRSCPWPGNVRQLRNAVERMVVFSRGPVLQADEVPDDVQGANALLYPAMSGGRAGRRQSGPTPAVLTPLQYQERQLIIDALRKTQDNVVQAAALLRMGQATVYRKIRQYEISYNRGRRKKG